MTVVRPMVDEELVRGRADRRNARKREARRRLREEREATRARCSLSLVMGGSGQTLSSRPSGRSVIHERVWSGLLAALAHLTCRV